MTKILPPKLFLRNLFEEAVAVADPMESLENFLPIKPEGRVVVVGAGKASARMAEAVENAWGPCEGLVITRYGYARPCQGVEIVEAAHPVPDRAGLDATTRMLELLDGLDENDFVLALISGGASALLVSPLDGLALEDKQAINDALLSSGAPIGQVNTVRKHLSQVKGGQLAAKAWPATMLSLMISDVPGDNPADIGSGPTVGDVSSPQDALSILKEWQINVPDHVLDALGNASHVLAPSHACFSNVTNTVFAAPSQSLAAAAGMARDQGCEVTVLGDAIEGEASNVAEAHAELALETKRNRSDNEPPVLLLSGGELTVTKHGDGTGGPNAEYCLALACALDGTEGVFGLACDTDGVDGMGEVAGAFVGPDTLNKARLCGCDPLQMLQNNDSHTLFQKIDDQIITGPTLTNVNDFRAILIC